jgi:hypothetical protein
MNFKLEMLRKIKYVLPFISFSFQVFLQFEFEYTVWVCTVYTPIKNIGVNDFASIILYDFVFFIRQYVSLSINKNK